MITWFKNKLARIKANHQQLLLALAMAKGMSKRKKSFVK